MKMLAKSATSKPLALYVFSEDKVQESDETMAHGGGCINDVVLSSCRHDTFLGVLEVVD